MTDLTLPCHLLTWHITGHLGIVGHVRCDNDEDATCRSNGPWVSRFSGVILKGDGEHCWVEYFFNSAEIESFWDGDCEERTLPAEGLVHVRWDGSDFLWWYPDEEPHMAELSDPGETVQP